MADSACHVCRRSKTLDCPNCGRPVCDDHAAAPDHDCAGVAAGDEVGGDRTDASFENVVAGSITVGGDGGGESDGVDTDELADLVDLKRRMDDDDGGGDPETAAIRRALQRTSALKAAAADPETERSALRRRIGRLLDLVDRIDGVDGDEIRELSELHAVHEDLRSGAPSDAERARLRDAAAALEDELHLRI
jgi:Asp-tRNA(Asn)/Glu-tRNA(Gln) amidotransferase C subunit